MIDPLAQGAVLAPGYRVVDHLSRGRALDVYDVWSESRSCRCAAKVLRPDRRNRSARSRLVREGELLLSLAHPHVVRAYELLRRPRLVLVLETLTGETLAHAIERRSRLDAADVRELGIQLCAAVSYLHRHGTLHLDVKPSNVVVDYGIAKLLDLSVAQPPGPVSARIGTRPYMAPEQASRGELTERTDVWGIGATLYEAASGARPFAGSEEEYPQLLRRAEPLRARRRLPAALARTIDACLEPDPVRRPAINELGLSLRELG
jgi:serine/threonine protein kinase